MLQLFDDEVLNIYNTVKAKYEAMGPDKYKRFIHIEGVCQMASYLANEYHVNLKDAQIAALLHDYYKYETPEEMSKVLSKEEIEECTLCPVLFHAYSSSKVLKKLFNIDNKEKSLKYLNIIREEANRSLNIITDFLEFNKIKIVKTEIDLNLLLEDVYDSFKIILNRKNIKLIYNDREDEEIYFDGDYERLKQVLINVLKNSVEAIKDKGKVEISSNIYKRHIDIIIEDDGIGMSEDTLKQLKTMFFTTKLNGSGLGVCLSNEIIKAHNGELIYTSKEGVGTKVTIRLPK